MTTVGAAIKGLWWLLGHAATFDWTRNVYAALTDPDAKPLAHFVGFVLGIPWVAFWIPLSCLAIVLTHGRWWSWNRKDGPAVDRPPRPTVKPPPPAPGRVVVQVVDRRGPIEAATAMFVSEENRSPGPRGNTDASGAVALDGVGEDRFYTLLVAHAAYNGDYRPNVEGRKRRQTVTLDDTTSGGSMLMVDSENYFPGFPLNRITAQQNNGKHYVHIRNMSVDGHPADPYYFELNKEFTVADHAGPQFRVTFRYSEGEVSLLDYVSVTAPEKRQGTSAPRRESPHILLAELGEYLDMRATSDPDTAKDGMSALVLLSARTAHHQETMQGYFSEYAPRLRVLYADLAQVDKQRDPALERLILQGAREPADIRKIQNYLYYLAL